MRCLIASVILAYISTVKSIDLKSAYEQPCFEIKETVPVDLNWTGKLYLPLLSRLDLYQTALELLQVEPSEILESSLYYEGCMTWLGFENSTFFLDGFGSRRREYIAKDVKPGHEDYELVPVSGPVHFKSKSYSTLTDNSTFLVTASCTETETSNQMSFTVSSTEKTLPKDTMEKIRDHVLKLGFKKEFFTEMRYDYCEEDQSAPTTTEMNLSDAAL